MPKIRKRILVILIIAIGTLFYLGIITEIIRDSSYKQLDDLHPQIICDEEYLIKSDVLMVIPLYKNDSIANYPDWCKKILSYNKTIGIHGIYHTYKEFSNNISEKELLRAIQEFEKCFGEKPKLFEPPQWEISQENKEITEKYLQVTNSYQGFFHKVYHCGNGIESTYKFLGVRINNKLIDKI